MKVGLDSLESFFLRKGKHDADFFADSKTGHAQKRAMPENGPCPKTGHAQKRAAIVSLLALTSLAALSAARPAQAQLTLTPAGTALGFSLSTFATGFPTRDNTGPLGIAFTSGGGVLVSSIGGGVRLFPTDTDGQNAAFVKAAQSYGFKNAHGLATIGNSIYMTQGINGDVVEINPNGTFNQKIVGGLGFALGIVADASSGHLFVSNQTDTIFDVNPIAKTATPFVSGVQIDGVALSADGKTLYGADNHTSHVLGFSILSGLQTFDSGYIAGGVDGTASGYGKLAGNLFVNNNDGTFVEINLATDAQTLIASGGSRGDFVTVDPTNNTLLLTQSDRILRLSGGNFGPVPEASTFVSTGLLMLGGLGLLLAARKRSRKA